MRVRSPRLIILAVCAALVVLFIAALGLARLITRPSIDVTWAAPGSDFSASDQQGIEEAISLAARSVNAGGIESERFSIVYAQRQGDQAYLGAEETSGSPSSSPPTAMLYVVARYQGNTWETWLPNSPGFCDQLNQLPAQLISADERGMFIGCGAS